MHWGLQTVWLILCAILVMSLFGKLGITIFSWISRKMYITENHFSKITENNILIFIAKKGRTLKISTKYR